MKKIYSLITILAASFAVNAQTALNTNGSLESWTDGTTQAAGWFMNTANLTSGIITKQTGANAQDGTVYVTLQAKSGTSGNNQVGLADITVTPGEEYTITYWVKGASATSNFKHWGQWRDSSAAISGVTDDFQPANPVTTGTTWTKVTATATAPATATILRFTFRNYTASSDMDIDNVVVFETNAASVKENNILGLNIFPNPATDIINITSNSNLEKNVQLFDLTGKKVLDTTVVSEMNVSSLNAGIYVAKITEAGKTATRKIVIK
ncbi:T9SS type A sorting domain-containing protein [Flavobacterium sp. xlx-214]|uniref:T9SS type A sorting domain-containing protein n=1 Tax=unclassified Flavobacterium TaxID=196869 RepID=UPI0013D3D537|nr:MULTISPECIES: T9SS type A sorting domain-containing protein [unclassified Flavobacterium]MBA5792931.1 T9SS type A sorting domain-containing protein [Flavobacterium sp. xlx-221]QMI84735.1 T9SS type A sorting domain-containing protein [Flavobacterium sp. xlx-214]